MPLLARNFHVLAPDLIGFGNSAAPSRESFEYTFENLTKNVAGFLAALKVDQYFLYVFDYGAPIGFRLAMRQPERVLGIVSQNGNIYQEGLGPKWAERAKYDHTTAQLMLRYLTQRQIMVIPRSTNPTHMAANLNIFDFALTATDLARVQALDEKFSLSGWPSSMTLDEDY